MKQPANLIGPWRMSVTRAPVEITSMSAVYPLPNMDVQIKFVHSFFVDNVFTDKGSTLPHKMPKRISKSVKLLRDRGQT